MQQYALISVDKPIGKENSLEFRIADGYKTPGINTDEIFLQNEMDVIIYIINRIFDENDPYYIGLKDEVVNINLRTDNILDNINKRPQVRLKNKGVRRFGKINTNIPITYITYIKNKKHKTLKKRSIHPQNISRNNIKNKLSVKDAQVKDKIEG
jgi:hypothetical protein